MSIDREGNAWPGAGTTIYRNVTQEPIEGTMRNLKVRELDHFMTLAAYDGGVTAYRLSFEGYEVEVNRKALPTVDQKERNVDDVVKIGHNRFIIVGSKQLLPLTTVVERKDRKVSVDFLFGHELDLPNDDDQWPHVDNLTNTTFALIYENGDKLIIRTGEWKGDGNGAELILSQITEATDRYEFHGIAGMDASHFIITVTGKRASDPQSWPVVRSCLCTVGDGKITMGTWKVLPFSLSHNFFDMDNFGPENVLMVFSDSEAGSIHAVMCHFDRTSNDIFYGSQREIQKGGAVLGYNRIDIRVLSPTSFAVFYEDQAIQGLCLVLCSVSPSMDIVITSPNYIISRTWGPDRHTDFYYDLCESGWGDFMIGEYRMSGPSSRVMFHRGVVLPRMFGIAQKSKKGKLTVQFAGMFKVPGSRKLTPGRAIYTNSKGELIEGAPYGYVNRNFGIFYEFSRADNSILSNNNLVGMAATTKKIYLKFQ